MWRGRSRVWSTTEGVSLGWEGPRCPLSTTGEDEMGWGEGSRGSPPLSLQSAQRRAWHTTDSQ